MSKVITIAATKGGSGKTTTCAVLAQAAVKDGKKVLAIDLDPQANLTMALGANIDQEGAYELIAGGADPLQAIQSTGQGIDVAAGSDNLATISTKPGSANRLRETLNQIADNYDLIFIDTPPTIGEMQFNALQAADGLIIPLEVDSFNLQALYQITDLAKQFQVIGGRLRILGTVLTRYDRRSKINQYYSGVMEEKGAAEGAPVIGIIRQGIAVKEAAAFQISLYDHAPKSNPARDYMDLYHTMIGSFADL